MTVVEYCGAEYVRKSKMEEGDGSGWPNVGDVVRDLGGWGDDLLVKPDEEDGQAVNGV